MGLLNRFLVPETAALAHDLGKVSRLGIPVRGQHYYLLKDIIPGLERLQPPTLSPCVPLHAVQPLAPPCSSRPQHCPATHPRGDHPAGSPGALQKKSFVSIDRGQQDALCTETIVLRNPGLGWGSSPQSQPAPNQAWSHAFVHEWSLHLTTVVWASST